MTLRTLPKNWPAQWPYRPDAGSVRARGGMVASTDRYASEAGAAVLREGGNASDAAVTVAFALAVVNPEAGNLGGGGFLVLREPHGAEAALDFRSMAPGAATRDLFLDSRVAADASLLGPLAAAVPGSVRGMAELHARFGRRSWASLVEPAVELARGFRVTERFTRSFEPEIVDGLRRFPSASRIFLPGGAPPRVGDVFVQDDLARTLARIRDDGADGFYRGRTAERISGAVQRAGGILTTDDLAAYAAVWRTPVRARYRGHTLVSMPPSSAGGVALAGVAGMLDGFDLGALPWHGSDHVHLLAEAWRRAYADRNHLLGDPDFVAIPLDTLTSAEYLRRRAGDIRLDRTTPSSGVGPGTGGQTTHFSIVDAEGGAVSVTTTLNTWYGSKFVAEGTGVLLNNEMDDLTTRPGTPNHFGLVQGEANIVEPGKRPLSAMTPTLLLDPDERLRLVVGTPGGATITTTVFQVVSNLLDHRMRLPAAVMAPRVHHQHLPDRLEYERGGLPPQVVQALEALGHETSEREGMSGDVQAILVRPDSGLLGISDPRRGGCAAGVP